MAANDAATRVSVWQIPLAIATALAVPFAATGIYRALRPLPSYPLWQLAPFVILGAALLVVGLWRPRWRYVAAAGWVSLVVYGVFLVWLFARMGSGLAEIG